jgi:hypothetical protein
MRTGLAAIASVWLTGLVVGNAQAEPFSFAGFHRDMDLATLVDRYPRSSHEVSPGADVRSRSSQDDPQRMDSGILSYSGIRHVFSAIDARRVVRSRVLHSGECA